MSWFTRQFDPAWVTCANWQCRTQFTLQSIARKRKCPRCKLDNRHCLPKAKP